MVSLWPAAVRLARSLSGVHQNVLGADKGFDTRDYVADLRVLGVTPHVVQNIQARGRSSVGAVFRLHVVAYNMIRLANLLRARE